MPSRLFALPRLFDLRAMLQHATTIWIGQLAVMAFAIADTLIAGRYATEALAALSVGTAIYFSVYIGQSVSGEGLPSRLTHSAKVVPASGSKRNSG